MDLYPKHPDEFPGHGVVSYLGVPLLAQDGRVLGHLAVIDVRPMPDEKRLLTLFHVFANRAVAEMRRVRVEQDLRERQEKLSRLICSAMDAIVEIDGELRITLMNAAATKVFACVASERAGTPDRGAPRRGGDGEAPDARGRARSPRAGAAVALDPGRPRRRASRGEAVRGRGDALALRGAAAAVLHAHPAQRGRADRGRARIRSLTAQADYLREELAAEHGFDEIVGRSAALRSVLEEVVAGRGRPTRRCSSSARPGRARSSSPARSTTAARGGSGPSSR